MRVVKFQLDNGDWETLVTTITDQKRFPLDKMKALYKLRWSVETSYRFLKYRIGMIKLHARKLNAVILELYAKILGFNLCFSIINMADINWHESKYKLKINISKALHRVLSFFREKEWLRPPIEYEISKYVWPVVDNKKSPMRKKRINLFVPDMQYRAA